MNYDSRNRQEGVDKKDITTTELIKFGSTKYKVKVSKAHNKNFDYKDQENEGDIN